MKTTPPLTPTAIAAIGTPALVFAEGLPRMLNVASAVDEVIVPVLETVLEAVLPDAAPAVVPAVLAVVVPSCN